MLPSGTSTPLKPAGFLRCREHPFPSLHSKWNDIASLPLIQSVSLLQCFTVLVHSKIGKKASNTWTDRELVWCLSASTVEQRQLWTYLLVMRPQCLAPSGRGPSWYEVNSKSSFFNNTKDKYYKAHHFWAKYRKQFTGVTSTVTSHFIMVISKLTSCRVTLHIARMCLLRKQLLLKFCNARKTNQ